MKKDYKAPIILIVEIEEKDILTTSTEGEVKYWD